jgi:uncharacterized phage protein gp47/JayE
VDAQGLTGGEETESVDAWRVRVSDEWQVTVTRGGRSGKPEDYRYWASQAHPSVSGALVQPQALGLGTVLVRPICNGLAGRMPTPGVLSAVSDHYAAIAPATADWRVAAPIAQLVVCSIHLVPGVDSAVNRARVDAALGALVLSLSSEGATLSQAAIDAAIAETTTAYTLLSPLADLTAAPGEVFVWGGVTWS